METIEQLNRRNISSIETFFDTLLRGSDKLTENLFFNELPIDISKSWETLAVVDCGNPLRDHDAYAVGTVLIFLYARQNAYGIKDVRLLQQLEQRLNALVQGNADAHYHLSIRGRYSNYNAVNDIYLNIVQLNLVIT